MSEFQKLQEENKRLKAELTTYKEAEKARQQKKVSFIKRLGSFGSWFFLGGNLKSSIKKLVVEIRDKDKELSNDTLGDVLAHGAWRFTRIGCFAVLVAFIPLAILSVQTTLLYYQNQKIDVQNKLVKAQNKRLDQQTHLQEANRRSSLVFLFSNIMDNIGEELLDKTKNRELSLHLRGQIIALSARFKSYKYLENDSLITRKLSPERGQLLISLAHSKLNQSTYSYIFDKGTFAYADLKDAYLEEPYWNSAFLWSSDLTGAHLPRAHLQNTNLRHSNLREVVLSGADLTDADLTDADLTDAILDSADLTGAILDSAKTNSLTFIKEDLDKWGIVGRDSIKVKYYVNPKPQYKETDKEKKFPYYLIKRSK